MDSVCRYVRGSIYLARGDIEAALAEARRGTEQARPVKDPQALNPAVAFEARVELAAGNLEAAGRLADELLAIWGSDGVGPQVEAIDGAVGLLRPGASRRAGGGDRAGRGSDALARGGPGKSQPATQLPRRRSTPRSAPFPMSSTPACGRPTTWSAAGGARTPMLS